MKKSAAKKAAATKDAPKLLKVKGAAVDAASSAAATVVRDVESPERSGDPFKDF